MDKSTVLQYENLSAEDLQKEAQRATREWMFRPGPIMTFTKSLTNIASIRSLLNIGFQQARWALCSRTQRTKNFPSLLLQTPVSAGVCLL